MTGPRLQEVGELAMLASVFRGRSGGAAGAETYKEWFHVCVHAGALDLILNFNVETPPRLGVAGRVLCLWRQARWHGCMTSHGPDEVAAERGRVAVLVGTHRLVAAAGGFEVAVRSPAHGVEIDLVLVPHTAPLRATSRGFGSGDLHWLVVPALRAWGTIRLPGAQARVEDAPAYHDHNWGAWRWGDDVAWQWGYALPERGDPSEAAVAVVYSRLLDRAGLRERDRRLNVWLGPTLARVFVGREVSWHGRGVLRPRHLLRVPAVLALAAPGDALCAPQAMTIEARAGGDWLRLVIHCDAEAAAQFLVPDETALSTTAIDELATTIAVSGMIDGRAIEVVARGMFEAVHAA